MKFWDPVLRACLLMNPSMEIPGSSRIPPEGRPGPECFLEPVAESVFPEQVLQNRSICRPAKLKHQPAAAPAYRFASTLRIPVWPAHSHCTVDNATSAPCRRAAVPPLFPAALQFVVKNPSWCPAGSKQGGGVTKSARSEIWAAGEPSRWDPKGTKMRFLLFLLHKRQVL